MDKSIIKFNYYTEIQEAYNALGFLYADVPAGFTTMLDLLKFYEQDKYITNWHAYNFSAFFDGIRAVEYYPESLNKIIHHDLPNLETPELTCGYLTVLNHAIQELEIHRELKSTSKPPYAAELKVYFPISKKSAIESSFEQFGLEDWKAIVSSKPNWKEMFLNSGENTLEPEEWKAWRKSAGLPEEPV